MDMIDHTGADPAGDMGTVAARNSGEGVNADGGDPHRPRVTRPALVRYSLAFFTSALALLLTLLYTRLIGTTAPFILFFAAVVVSSWYGGLGPGLLAIAIAALVTDYFFLPPTQSLHMTQSSFLELLLFLLAALLIAWLTAALRSAYRRAEAAQIREKLARAEAERAQRRFAFLFEASALLAGSLDWRTTLASMADLAVPEMADWCLVDVTEPDGAIRRVATAKLNASRSDQVHARDHRYLPDLDAPFGVSRVMRTGEPEIYPKIPEPVLVDLAHGAEDLALMRQIDPKSAMIVPLVARNRTLGTITFISAESGRHYGPGDLALAEVLARRAALAVDNTRLYRELAESKQQLQNLVGRLLVAQEEERRRVSYEVHDELAQVANAAQLHLETYAHDYPPGSLEAREDLERAVELARRTVRDARRVVNNLRPTTLDDFGLAAALRLHVEELRAEGWQIGYQEGLGEDRLPPLVETALFRVAQESLTNVRKHAQTTQASVTLDRRRNAVHLEVQDWGRGFDPAGVREAGAGERVGLPGMRERIAWLGGHCIIESEPGGGTRVTVEVPLEGAVANEL
jgi:signal transduction histidine kinase